MNTKEEGEDKENLCGHEETAANSEVDLEEDTTEPESEAEDPPNAQAAPPERLVEDEVPLETGTNYLVRRADGQWYQADILDYRELENQEEIVQYQYYVHFKGLNRRLDEWVLRSRVMSENLNARDSPSSLSEILFPPEENGVIDTKKLTRNQKRKLEEFYQIQTAVGQLEIRSKNWRREHERQTKDQIKYIDTVQFGKYEMDTWYASPYPEEYGKVSKLFICEFCLKYMRLEKTFCYHYGACTFDGPPGKEIYRKEGIAVWEVNGKDNKVYCQNLCLLSKLFLDDKTLYFDVDPFLFYILCEVDREGSHFVGYFSKEKESPDGYNLSCILTLPPYQRKGYGKFLISFSYELSRLEKTIGTPEKPLSDLGLLSYRSYWSYIIVDTLLDSRGFVSIKDLCAKTAIAKADIVSTLKSLKLFKYWKDPNSVSITPAQIAESCNKEHVTIPTLLVDVSCLRWNPKR